MFQLNPIRFERVMAVRSEALKSWELSGQTNSMWHSSRPIYSAGVENAEHSSRVDLHLEQGWFQTLLRDCFRIFFSSTRLRSGVRLHNKGD